MRSLLMLLIAASAVSCEAPSPPSPPPQIVHVRVFSEPGHPTPSAELLFNGEKIATTDASGLGKIALEGEDGDSFEIAVLCPEGYLSPEKPIPVTLERAAHASREPEYTATCPPAALTRTVVVAVRAENGPDLPITYLGQEVARTDKSGAAHVLLKLKPGNQFDLTLKTSDKRHEALRPQNPTATFVVGQRDEVLNFDQKFEKEAKRAVVRRARPRGPVKISK